MDSFSNIRTNTIVKAFDSPNISGTEGYPEGTIRDWKGGKYIKRLGKWFPYVEGQALGKGPKPGKQAFVDVHGKPLDPKKAGEVEKLIEKLKLPYKVVKSKDGFYVVPKESPKPESGSSEELHKYEIEKEATSAVEKIANKLKLLAGSDWEDFNPTKLEKPIPYYNFNLYSVIVPNKGEEKQGNGTAILVITASQHSAIKLPSISEFTSSPSSIYPNGIEIAKVENFHIKPKEFLSGLVEAKEALISIKEKIDETPVNLAEAIKEPKFASQLLSEFSNYAQGGNQQDLWAFLERKYSLSENQVKAFNVTYTLPELFNNYEGSYTLYYNGRAIAKLYKE